MAEGPSKTAKAAAYRESCRLSTLNGIGQISMGGVSSDRHLILLEGSFCQN
jgi:hypothetical protein